jgi:hypothetical protein
MNDYMRRAGKFIIYMVVIFMLVLVIFPMISGRKMPGLTWNNFIHNQRFIIFFGFLLAYSFVYPLIAFVSIKRHLNGTFANNREVFEKAFDTLQYIKTEETPDKIVYRRKSKFVRFSQWYEDSIVIDTTENPVVISGLRKAVTRIDRIIDQLLIKASE